MTSTAHTAGAAGVTLPELVEVVAGEVAPATGTLDLYLEDPSRAVRLGRAVESAPESVERALRAADDAHATGTWSSTPPAERADLLDAVLEHLPARTATENPATASQDEDEPDGEWSPLD